MCACMNKAVTASHVMLRPQHRIATACHPPLLCAGNDPLEQGVFTGHGSDSTQFGLKM